MDARIEFWRNPGRWPVEIPGYVFASRAVLEVGRVVFGDLWTGTEPLAAEPFNFRRIPLLGGQVLRQSQSQVTPSDKERINMLLRQHRPEMDRPLPEYGPYGPKPLIFSHEEWEAGLDLAEDVDKDLTAMHRRFNAVVSNIVEACANGSLLAALRPKQGGKMGDPLPPHLWHTEPARAAVRFVWGQMHPDPQKAFEYAVGGDAFHYLYFGRESLDALLRSLAAPAADKRDAPETQRRQTSQGAAIERALIEIPQWGGKVPRGLAPKKRDAQIQEFAKAHELSIPDSRTIRRHLKERNGQ